MASALYLVGPRLVRVGRREKTELRFFERFNQPSPLSRSQQAYVVGRVISVLLLSLRTLAFATRDDPLIEYCPHCYNARGPKFVKQRSLANTAQSVLDQFGGGKEYPLYHGEFAANGNYLETDEIAVRHGICGDPEQVREWLRFLQTKVCGRWGGV